MVKALTVIVMFLFMTSDIAECGRRRLKDPTPRPEPTTTENFPEVVSIKCDEDNSYCGKFAGNSFSAIIWQTLFGVRDTEKFAKRFRKGRLKSTTTTTSTPRPPRVLNCIINTSSKVICTTHLEVEVKTKNDTLSEDELAVIPQKNKPIRFFIFEDYPRGFPDLRNRPGSGKIVIPDVSVRPKPITLHCSKTTSPSFSCLSYLEMETPPKNKPIKFFQDNNYPRGFPDLRNNPGSGKTTLH